MCEDASLRQGTTRRFRSVRVEEAASAVFERAWLNRLGRVLAFEEFEAFPVVIRPGRVPALLPVRGRRVLQTS